MWRRALRANSSKESSLKTSSSETNSLQVNFFDRPARHGPICEKGNSSRGQPVEEQFVKLGIIIFVPHFTSFDLKLLLLPVHKVSVHTGHSSL